MYSLSAKQTPEGYDVFRDGKPTGSSRNDHELELHLNFHGFHEGFCRDFIHRLKETGSATEEMPTVHFRQVPCPW